MENKKDDLTPMVRQYMEIKKEHQDKVLFFRLGDFYEMFNDDAVLVSKLLNLTLTHRGAMPMCGIPYHAAKSYLKRLLDYGLKVALCEQFVRDDRKLAERSVTQIFTPATVVDEDFVDANNSSFVLSLYVDRKNIYSAYSDITTGEFKIISLPIEKNFSNLESLLYKIEPKEILVVDDTYYSIKEFRSVLDSYSAIVTKLPQWYFTLKEGKRLIEKQFGQSAMRLSEIGEKDNILCAVSALLDYINENTKSELPQLRFIERVSSSSFMDLNWATIRNLELVHNTMDSSSEYTLLSSIKRTKTPSGARFLKDAILHPLCDTKKIKERLDWIEYFLNNKNERDRIRRKLVDISDIERLSSKASMKRLTPRDLIAISESIFAIVEIIEENEKYLEIVDNFQFDFASLIDFSASIEKAINKECTNINNSGTIILSGYDKTLDEIREIKNGGSNLLSEYLERIKNDCGITNIKVGENRIIGSYIEVSKAQLDRVPSYFIRRQTLVGGERFTTSELMEIEEKILSAKDDEAKRERSVYSLFIDKAFSLYKDLEKLSRIVTLLDFYSSGATLAEEKNYCRPNFTQCGDIIIKNARHPVVEDYTENYIPSSFSSEDGKFSLVTGPNMAGKSTYLRAIALITLLSHIGYYCSAEEVTLPIIDKIFCRVGANDNLSKGESTFLVEMSESSQILRSMTSHSLVIMDEIGRGTSTEDGMSIAYAIMNYLKSTGAVTLFSTHYHELGSLDTSGIQLLRMAVLEEKNQITFLRKAEKGVSQSSYGIHVAKLAGIPREIINDASSFMKKHFVDYSLSSEEGNLFSEEPNIVTLGDEIIQLIEDFNTDSSTPLEALMFINTLKEKIEEEK